MVQNARRAANIGPKVLLVICFPFIATAVAAADADAAAAADVVYEHKPAMTSASQSKN